MFVLLLLWSFSAIDLLRLQALRLSIYINHMDCNYHPKDISVRRVMVEYDHLRADQIYTTTQGCRDSMFKYSQTTYS
jgi:hypothetical protein